MGDGPSPDNSERISKRPPVKKPAQITAALSNTPDNERQETAPQHKPHHRGGVTNRRKPTKEERLAARDNQAARDQELKAREVQRGNKLIQDAQIWYVRFKEAKSRGLSDADAEHEATKLLANGIDAEEGAVLRSRREEFSNVIDCLNFMDLLMVKAKDSKDEVVASAYKLITNPIGDAGAAIGASGFIALGEADQGVTSVLGVIDEPGIALLWLLVHTIKKTRALHQDDKTLRGWLKESIQKQLAKIRYDGVAGTVKRLAKPTAALATMLTLGLVALEDETLAKPIDAFFGAGIGYFASVHTAAAIRGEESAEDAIHGYARRAFPHVVEEMQHAIKSASIVGTQKDAFFPHGRGGWQEESKHRHPVKRDVAPGRSPGGRTRN